MLFLSHLIDYGTNNSPYPIKKLQGAYKKYNYLEAKIDSDYRIIFRQEGNIFLIRDAGTHNKLHTG